MQIKTLQHVCQTLLKSVVKELDRNKVSYFYESHEGTYVLRNDMC